MQFSSLNSFAHPLKVQKFIEHPQSTRQYVECIEKITSFNLCINSVRQILWSPFYGRENWGSESWSCQGLELRLVWLYSVTSTLCYILPTKVTQRYIFLVDQVSSSPDSQKRLHIQHITTGLMWQTSQSNWTNVCVLMQQKARPAYC